MCSSTRYGESGECAELHFAGERHVEGDVYCTAACEHEASGMSEQNVRKKKLAHTHVLELEHKLEMQQRLLYS